MFSSFPTTTGSHATLSSTPPRNGYHKCVGYNILKICNIRLLEPTCCCTYRLITLVTLVNCVTLALKGVSIKVARAHMLLHIHG